MTSTRVRLSARWMWGVGAAVLLGALGISLWSLSSQKEGGPEALSGDFHSLWLTSGQKLLYGEHAGTRTSTNWGRSWTAADGMGDAMSISSSPKAPEVLYRAGHDFFSQSVDGGESWKTFIPGDLPGTDVHGFTVQPDQPGTLFANLAGQGLYRSRDAGLHWQLLSPDTAGVMALAASVNRLFALDMNGLLVSEGGSVWRRAGQTPPAAMSGLAAQPDGKGVFLAGPQGVYRSRDGGADWEKLAFPGAALLVAVNPQDDQELYAVSEAGLTFHSTDGGVQWKG